MTANRKLLREDILYPELSYQIIGVLFEIYNKFGPRYYERYYQKAIAETLRKIGLSFKEQVPVSLVLENKIIARGYMDFVIEGKVALEVKRGERFLKSNIDQLLSYLKLGKLKLGILANFSSRGLQFKRVVNINS